MKQNHKTRRSFALSSIVLTALALTAIVGCLKNDSLPTEFKLTRVLHQKKVSQLMGPGGGNHSFTVYELPKEVSATIADQGLTYLNSLPSALGKKAPDKTAFSGPFVDWHATPVSRAARWLRHEDEQRFEKRGGHLPSQLSINLTKMMMARMNLSHRYHLSMLIPFTRLFPRPAIIMLTVLTVVCALSLFHQRQAKRSICLETENANTPSSQSTAIIRLQVPHFSAAI